MPPRRATAVIAALALPLLLPPLLVAVMLLVWYLFLDIGLGLGTVVLSHLLFTLPFVLMVVYARLASFDFRIVESARDLGASPFRAFFDVTLPVIRPIVIGATLMAVALSIDDFIFTTFTIGGGNTIPILVMSSLRTSVAHDQCDRDDADRHQHHLDGCGTGAHPVSWMIKAQRTG